MEVETETTRVANTADCAGSDTAGSIGAPIEASDLFIKRFDELCEQYYKGHMTEGLTKLALAIPEQESVEMPAATVKGIDAAETAYQSIILTVETMGWCGSWIFHHLTLNLDLAQMQGNVGLWYDVAIVLIRYNPITNNQRKLTLPDIREMENI